MVRPTSRGTRENRKDRGSWERQSVMKEDIRESISSFSLLPGLLCWHSAWLAFVHGVWPACGGGLEWNE